MEANPTIDMRDGEELDLVKLDQVLKEIMPSLNGYPKVRQYASGNSNLTYLVSYASREIVLRRPPLGEKAISAHSMLREYRVLTGLHKVYDSVPKSIFYTADESLLGAEFYLMEKVDGVLVKTSFPESWNFNNSDRYKFCQIIFDKLIELHLLNYSAAGLDNFGKPDGYTERQILGWNRRYLASLTEDVPDFQDVRDWLEAHIPAETSPKSIVHGDFRIDNVMVDTKDPFSVVAVLDWEMAALGDPRMDLANSMAYWFQEDDPDELRAMKNQPSDASGMMRRDEILDYYFSKTGFETKHWDFYEVYGYFRLAVISQQLYYRFVNKQTKDSRFSKLGELASHLGRHCQKLIKRSFL
jgi:aminoglycoside phosphotransferase (APT) family kinase protein